MSERQAGRFLTERVFWRRVIAAVGLLVTAMLGVMGFWFWPMSLAALLMILYLDRQSEQGRWLNPQSWLKGLQGERAVGKAFEQLPESYRVIHDLDIGRGNVDHVVIGPTGVFAIETKEWEGRLTVRADRLFHNGREAAETRKQAIRGAMEVRRRLAAAGMANTWVEAIIVSTRALLQDGELDLPQTKVLGVNALVPHIQRSRQGLSAEQIARAAGAVDRPPNGS